MEAYEAHFAPEAGDEVRRRIGVGVYELGALLYFRQWQPDLVPVYQARLEHWLTHR
jgi:hypothetical protein